MSVNLIPIIAIDGPSASGKGTVSQLVANKLGFHLLDSGALYRIVALAAQQRDIAWSDADTLGKMAGTLAIEFKSGEIYLNQKIVSQAVRSEEMSRGASQVAVHSQVRNALFDLQHSFRKAPGLVADGRDMGSVVFKEALLKIFLTADVEIRAQRRYEQALSNNMPADYAHILNDLKERDARDSQRNAAPLLQTPDAIFLDTSHRSIEDAVAFVLDAYQNNLKNRSISL